jgi:Tol biopolymer transport system component
MIDSPPVNDGQGSEPSPEKEFRLNFNLRIRKKFLLYAILPLVVIGLLLIGLIQQGIVGSARVASLALTVIDEQQQPIDNAQIEIGAAQGATAEDGSITLTDLPRGTHTLSVSKTGFTPYAQEVTLKRGRNNLGSIVLQEASDQKVAVTLSVSDYISEEPLTDVSASIEDIIGTFDETEKSYKFAGIPLGTYSLKLSRAGFNAYTAEVTIGKDTEQLAAVALVPAGLVVFESNREQGRRGIYTANYDGTNQKKLVESVGDLEDYTPILGPNQRKVFFTSTRDGLKREDNPAVYKEFFYLVDLDGRNLVKISETSGSYAVWSPDGSYIGYTKYVNNYAASELYVYDVLKRTAHRFTGYNSSSFSFSPDGTLIAFGAKKEGEDTFKLFYAKSNATGVTEVAQSDTNSNFYGMEFTANNQLLRYSRWDDTENKTRWFEYSLASGTTAEVSAPAVDREAAVTSPNKKLRAYISTRDGKTNLYISDPDGKNEKRLTDLNRVVGSVLWSRDSSFVMFDYRSDSESARYLVSVNGTAKPKKIVDVNLTYYY